MIRRPEKESEAERRFRDYLLENYLATGDDTTRVLYTTSDLMEQVRDLIPALTPAEASRQLEYLGFSHTPIDHDVLWELYEHTPPIDRWK